MTLTYIDQNHFAIFKTIKFLTKLHELLTVMVRKGTDHDGLHQVITNLIYLPTLLNGHIRDSMKNYLLEDCRTRMKNLDCEFNPDFLQIIYFDLVLLNTLVKPKSQDQELFQLLNELAEINVAEVHLYLIRFCIEKGWNYEFSVK